MGGGEPSIDQHFARLIARLSDGNPGALRTIYALLNTDSKLGSMALGYLEAVKIRGPLIWLCYKDICNSDINLLLRKISDDTLPVELADLPYSDYVAPKRFM